MTFAVGESAGAIARCGSARAANLITGFFVRKFPEVTTTAAINRFTFPDHRRVPKNWAGNQFLATFQRTTMVRKSGTIEIREAHPVCILPNVVVGRGVFLAACFRPALTSKSGL